MRLFRTIRSKLLAAAVTLAVTVAGGVGVGAAFEAGREAESRVRSEIGRTALVLAHGGFLHSPEVLRRLARLLGAEVATLAEDGAVIATTFDARPLRSREPHTPERATSPLREGASGRTALEKLLVSAGGVPPVETVREVALAGRPMTMATAAVPGSRDRLALLYEGHLLSSARSDAFSRGLFLGLAGLAFAVAAAALLARSLVRPIERLSTAARRIARGDREARLEVRTGDEVEALARSLDGMVADLRVAEARAHEAEKLAALGRLMIGVAHEIKNPLAAIRMMVELLGERMRAPEDREAVGLVLDEIEKLALFAANVLTHARGPVVRARAVDVALVVHDVTRLLGRQLAHVGVRVEVRGTTPSLVARADPIPLRHVIMNLVVNAAEAMPRGGSVLVTLEGDSRGGATVEVADEGGGVAPEDVARLFHPFFSRKPGGTGLGLAMSRAIIAAHGGAISYRPRREGGSVFSLTLPPLAGAARAPALAGRADAEWGAWASS